VGHQARLGHGGGHTTWTCRTCDQTVYGPPMNTHCTTLEGGGHRAHLYPAMLKGPVDPYRWRAVSWSGLNLGCMRYRDTIDAELRLLTAVRQSIRSRAARRSSRQGDELLDERNAR
jgi:hypothetical protein